MGWVGCWILAAGFSFAAEPDPGDPTLRPASYRALVVDRATGLSDLRSELGRDGMLLLQRVNRRDLVHMRAGTLLMVPEGEVSLESLSPFPLEVPEAGALPKLLLVNQRVQAFAAYVEGRLVHWGPVSTGSIKQPTPNGLYHTNWKAPSRRSTINRNWLMRYYYNIHTSMGLALHQYAMPGIPASYGCVRLLAEDARWLYDWADPWIASRDPAIPRAWGTPVVVFGDYDYGSPPPWHRLEDDPAAASVDSEEITRALDPYLWVLEKRRLERIAVLEETAGAVR